MDAIASHTETGNETLARDRVTLAGISARGYHGVLEAERAAGQDFVVDLTLFLDTRAAAASDNLSDTVNYAHVADAVVSVLAGDPVNLIETVAERIAAVVLEQPAVFAVTVTVHKPQAPIAVPFGDVDVTISRSRINPPVVARPFAPSAVAPVASLPSWEETPEELAPEPTQVPAVAEPVAELPEPVSVFAPTDAAVVAPIAAAVAAPQMPSWSEVFDAPEAPETTDLGSVATVFSPVNEPVVEPETALRDPDETSITEPAVPAIADPEPADFAPVTSVFAAVAPAAEAVPEPVAPEAAEVEPTVPELVDAEFETTEPELTVPELEPEPESQHEFAPDYPDLIGNDDVTQLLPIITDLDEEPAAVGAPQIIEPSPESLAIYQALRAQVLGAPEAPSESAVAIPEGDVMDRVPLTPARVVLALGGNLGDAQATLQEAVADLAKIAGFEVDTIGPLARTGAVGGPADQPDYLNTVVLGRTTLSARALLAQTQAIELAHGRERLEHWGPRTLDVDIIDYEGVIGHTTDLELPHPRANQRAFVLVPWSIADPQAYLPGLGGGPVGTLADTATDRETIRWVALEWLT